MKHYGDITKIDGAKIEKVNVITGGSPCQDLSVAGKREGLAGERSGLFMEQIRVVKEMREDDIRMGRSAFDARPRFMVWENVPGAFSSNRGQDFQAVLTEIVRIADPEAPDVPMPDGGGGKWTHSGLLYDYLGRWSVAWRVHDAQFWGVPQRRKRIAVVADFGGLTAPEILFEREGMSGDSEQGTEARQEAAGSTGEGANPSIARTLGRRMDGSPCADRGPQVVLMDAYQHHGYREGATCGTLTKDQNGNVRGDTPLVCYGISAYESNAMKSSNPHSGIYEAETARTLDNNGGSPACNQGGMAVVAIEGNGSRESHKGDGYKETETMYTLNSVEQHAVCFEPRSPDGVARVVNGNVSPTLNTMRGGATPTVRGSER